MFQHRIYQGFLLNVTIAWKKVIQLEDIRDQWMIKKGTAIRKGFNYLYSNYERFPAKYLVSKFQKEQEEIKRKVEEKNKEEEKGKKKNSAYFMLMDNLVDWEPPFVTTGLEEPLRYAYGLSETKQSI
ncbi:hypothetical protein O181_018430 [Austropuccinia psidii MF-1]|uniref:Uncharacterized protein n=1 Tax=Austropuccinia psidii MF-1 TaxID=1389203 RepID=A0A9Q3C8R3_9BASI|nr:hypothetical protein [Austropuccinia psidii MF-1]